MSEEEIRLVIRVLAVLIGLVGLAVLGIRLWLPGRDPNADVVAARIAEMRRQAAHPDVLDEEHREEPSGL